MSAGKLSKPMPETLKGGAARIWINSRVSALEKSNVANKDQLIADYRAYRDKQFPEVVAVGPPAAPPKKASQNAVGPPAAPSKKASQNAVGPPASSPTSEISVAQLQQQIIDLQQQLAPKNSGGGNSSTPVGKKKTPCRDYNGTPGSCQYDDSCWFIHNCPPSAQPSGPPSGGGGKAKPKPKPKTKADTEREFIAGSGKISDSDCAYLEHFNAQVGGASHFPITKGNVYATANPDIASVMCDNNMHNCPDGWKCLKCHSPPAP